jgi:hypothetical protein
MALAAYQSLCLDVVDVERMQPFWATVLGLSTHTREDGVTWLEGPTPQHRVWVNEVPEPVTVKQRVHLDVHAASTESVLSLGATAYDVDSFSWDVLRDPEGGELCVFSRDVVPEYRLYELGVDSVEPHEIAAWWGEVLGVPALQEPSQPWSWVEDVPGMPFESIVFAPVPEPKTVKNRVHWDLDVPDVSALLDRGASLVREPTASEEWFVLADPEGNEFCAFPA